MYVHISLSLSVREFVNVCVCRFPLLWEQQTSIVNNEEAVGSG